MIAAMWSGGKDSALALKRAKDLGIRVSAIISMLDRDKRSRAHGFGEKKILEQAESLGMQVFFSYSDWDSYAIELRELLLKLDVKTLIFGDIFLEAHRVWLEKFCLKLGIEPIFPLWNEKTEKIAREAARDFEIYIVSTKKDFSRFLGRRFDETLIEELEKAGIDPCGENGEFHTFVADGVIFKKRVDFKFGKVVESDKYVQLEVL